MPDKQHAVEALDPSLRFCDFGQGVEYRTGCAIGYKLLYVV